MLPGRIFTCGPYLLIVAVLAASAVRAQAPPAETPHSSKAQSAARSNAVDAGDYVYISGQSGNRPDGTIPDKFEERASQALENIKTAAQSSGLDMDHVVYVQVYLEDINNSEKLNQVLAKYFPRTPPAGAVLGVARVPQSGIAINAVAVRDLAGRKAISPSAYQPVAPFSPGMLTHDRLFISAMQGRDPATKKIPDDPAAQTDLALDGFKAVVEAAGLTLGHVVFVNPYLTQKVPTRVMNERYARRFEFGNTPARATIEVSGLPANLQIEYTGVAVRDLSQRRAVRPKNMPPSPTASPCVFAGDTFYCSAKSGFIPGPQWRRLRRYHRRAAPPDHAESARQSGRGGHGLQPGGLYHGLSRRSLRQRRLQQGLRGIFQRHASCSNGSAATSAVQPCQRSGRTLSGPRTNVADSNKITPQKLALRYLRLQKY